MEEGGNEEDDNDCRLEERWIYDYWQKRNSQDIKQHTTHRLSNIPASRIRLLNWNRRSLLPPPPLPPKPPYSLPYLLRVSIPHHWHEDVSQCPSMYWNIPRLPEVLNRLRVPEVTANQVNYNWSWRSSDAWIKYLRDVIPPNDGSQILLWKK